MLFTEFQVNTLKIIHSLYQPHHHHQHSNNSSNNNNHSNTTTTNNNTTNNNSNHSDNNSHGIIISTSIHTNDPIQLNQFYDLLYKLIIFIKVILYTLIIISALFGNALVFIAYIKYKQLRSIHTNLFLVSLSIADFLVALLVMPLNAIMSLLNYKWIFGQLLCHIYNATDVLFTTSSILHLCCISMDRYIAIIYPLNYEKRMSKKYIIILLCIIWTLSFMISYIPILLGLHKPLYSLMDRSQIQINISSISRMKQKLDHHDDHDHDDTDLFLCNFNVNPYYAIISSSISFWIPSIIMILVYIRIFIEAKKQEKKIIQLYTPYNITQINNTMIMQQINKDQNNQTNAILIHDPTINRSSSRSSSSSPSSSCSSPSTSSSLSSKLHHINKQYYSNIKIQHENKAARTLGIVMGAFLLCWLPFFLWYTITNLCKQCQYPNELQEILYWIGYFNSSINPIIYAYYNRIFRQAFIKIIELHKGNIINNEPQQQSINDHNDKLPITRRYKYNTVNQLITTSVKRGGGNHDN
ncbi:unnamed protein product [Schistosoma bovis]|nr:unnamed protein product [Schistosoma bovis]